MGMKRFERAARAFLKQADQAPAAERRTLDRKIRRLNARWSYYLIVSKARHCRYLNREGP